MGLELGKGHFDWIEVGRGFRQEEHPGTACMDGSLGLGAFVNGQIIEALLHKFGC